MVAFTFPDISNAYALLGSRVGDPATDPDLLDWEDIQRGDLKVAAQYAFAAGFLSARAEAAARAMESLAGTVLVNLQQGKLRYEDFDEMLFGCRFCMHLVRSVSPATLHSAKAMHVSPDFRKSSALETMMPALENDDARADLLEACECMVKQMLDDALPHSSGAMPWSVRSTLTGSGSLLVAGEGVVTGTLAAGELSIAAGTPPTLRDYSVQGAPLKEALCVPLFGAGNSAPRIDFGGGRVQPVVFASAEITDPSAMSAAGDVVHYLVFCKAAQMVRASGFFDIDLRLNPGWNAVYAFADCILGTNVRSRPFFPAGVQLFPSPGAGWDPRVHLVL